jgi:hypothetical protein
MHDFGLVLIFQDKNGFHWFFEYPGYFQCQDCGRDVFIAFNTVDGLPGYRNMFGEFGLRHIPDGPFHA